MSKITVIKAYGVLTDSLKTANELAYLDDKAVAEYRAFYHVGHLYAEQVTNGLALNTMLEITEQLNLCLQERKKLLNSQ